MYTSLNLLADLGLVLCGRRINGFRTETLRLNRSLVFHQNHRVATVLNLSARTVFVTSAHVLRHNLLCNLHLHVRNIHRHDLLNNLSAERSVGEHILPLFFALLYLSASRVRIGVDLSVINLNGRALITALVIQTEVEPMVIAGIGVCFGFLMVMLYSSRGWARLCESQPQSRGAVR